MADFIEIITTATKVVEVIGEETKIVEIVIPGPQGPTGPPGSGGGGNAFATRALLVTAIAGGLTLAAGEVAWAAGLAYRWSTGATALPGLPNLLPASDALVDHFGALGDDSSDPTAATQAAIAYALAAGGQRDVRFGSGTYKFPCATSLDPGAGGLTFVGDGKYATIIKIDEGTPGSKKYWMKNILNVAKAGLRFEGVQLLGTLATVAQRAGSPLWLDYYSDIEIENCRFYNIGAEAMDIHYCGRLHCADCEFENIAADCVRARDTSDCFISANQIRRAGDDSIALHTNADTLSTFPIRGRMLVSGNTVVNGGPIKATGGRQIIVTDNNLSLMHGHAIDINSTYLGFEGENPQHDVVVTGNIINDMVLVHTATPGLATAAITIVAMTPRGGTLTNGVIPGDYDPVSGTVIKPWDWMEADGATTTDGIPRLTRLDVSGNTIGRTSAAVAQFSDFGYGTALHQGISYNPAMTDADISASFGIWLGDVAAFTGFDLSNNSINNVRTAIGIPAPTSHRDYQNGSINNNTITDTPDRGILIATGAFTVDVEIADNIIDCDPYRRNANSNINGSYAADSVPRAIDTGNCTGVRVSRNTVRNACKALHTNVPGSILQRDNIAIASQPVAIGFSTSNKGIGNVPNDGGWQIIVADGDITSATYRNHGQKLLEFSSAMPSSGWYPVGWFTRDLTGALLGWVRKTTGTAHVLDTDWAAVVPGTETAASLRGRLMDGTAGTSRLLSLESGGVKRWELGINGVAESGGNAGSDFLLTRYADDGVTLLSTPIYVIRSSGAIQIDTLGLTNDLGVAHGGTGVSTITGLIKGNGGSPFTAAVAGTDYAHAFVRDTAANFTTNNPVLAAGRLGTESDTGRGKFGDGATAWNSLLYHIVPIHVGPTPPPSPYLNQLWVDNS